MVGQRAIQFGWFVPFFALYLCWLRWQDAPPAPEVRSQKSEVSLPRRSLARRRVVGGQKLVALVIGIIALLLLLPVRFFEIANPEWRPLAWVHAASVVTLTLLLIWWTGGSRWVRHFAFPVAFIFVAVPWPTALETPIIQGLMRVVARVAAETAMLLGTPAQVEGNLIRVSTGLVGVNEACSGIRSLQTSLMIGLLFGELKRLSVLRRVALVAGAVAIALLANFFRAVFLVMVAATENLSEVSRWHDIAGYTIIALVFVGTMGLAYLLGRKQRTVAAGVSPAESGCSGMRVACKSQPARLPLQFPAPYLTAALCWLLFVEIGTAAGIAFTNAISSAEYVGVCNGPNSRRTFANSRSTQKFGVSSVSTRARRRHGRLTSVVAACRLRSPRPRKGLREPKDSGTQVNRARENTISCLLYLFRWKPGRNSALLANLHRPDVCLPASGWTQVADDGVRNYPGKRCV